MGRDKFKEDLIGMTSLENSLSTVKGEAGARRIKRFFLLSLLKDRAGK